MSKRAILIGINYTGKDNALQGCVNDAIALFNLLRSRYGFMPKDMSVLVDDKTPNRADLIPQLPTRQNILAAMGRVLRDVKPGDHIVFSFSGHGAQSGKDASNDESDGKDECFLLLDGVLTDDDFARDFLCKLPAGVKATIITDCCHSGTLCDMRLCYAVDQATNKPTARPEPRGATPIADIIAISAALDSQIATDGSYEGKWVVLPSGQRQFQWSDRHGALTWSLMKVFDAAAYAPIPASELLTRVHQYIQNTIKKSQVPHLSVSKVSLLQAPLL